MAAVVLWSAPGRADAPASALDPDGAPPAQRLRLHWLADGAAVVASGLSIGLSTQIPVDQSTRWNTQLLPFDHRLEGRYSSGAADLSNALLAADVAIPAALFVGQGFDVETGKRVGIYAETILVQFALDSLIKPWVGRPRPYTYSEDPDVIAYGHGKGRDSRYSFYSVHASTAFSASVAGAYLYAQTTSDTRARATVWGVELALAAATADLRTRAGQHFYSDVLVGGVIGSGLGVLIPYLHGGPRVHLDKLEWLAIVIGPLVGVAVGELLPTK